MADSTIVKNFRDGTLVIEDGASEAYTASLEQGDISITIPGPAVSVYLDRGSFGTTPNLRYGEEQASNGSFTGYLTSFTGSGATTLSELITFDQDSSVTYTDQTWQSTLGANAEVSTVKLTFTIEGTDHGDAADHTVVLDHCTLDGSVAEGDPSTVSLNFTSYERYPTFTS